MTLIAAVERLHPLGLSVPVDTPVEPVDVWLHAHRDLIQAIEPHLRWLSGVLADRPHGLILADQSGTVLFALTGGGDDPDRLGLFPGAAWAGCTDLETATQKAISSGLPALAQVQGHENGIRCGQAVPIRSPEGTVVGAIEVNRPLAHAQDLGMLLAHLAWDAERHLATLVGAFLQRRLLRVAPPHNQQDLERVRQLCDDVLRVVAHDLRNPVAIVMMGAGILAIKGAERGDPKVETILHAAERMEQLIGNIVDLTEFTLGTGELYPTAMPLRRLLKGAIRQPVIRALGRRVLVMTPEAGWPMILADERLMVQGLAGLMAVAGAMGGRDLIWSGEVARTHLDLHLASLEMPWQPDWRGLLEGSIRQCEKLVPGSGLGMMLARSLIKAHDGTLAIERTGDGFGRFTVRLALAPEP